MVAEDTYKYQIRQPEQVDVDAYRKMNELFKQHVYQAQRG